MRCTVVAMPFINIHKNIYANSQDSRSKTRHFFLSLPRGDWIYLLTDRVPSNRRLQSPPGRTGSLARGSYNFRLLSGAWFHM